MIYIIAEYKCNSIEETEIIIKEYERKYNVTYYSLTLNSSYLIIIYKEKSVFQKIKDKLKGIDYSSPLNLDVIEKTNKNPDLNFNELYEKQFDLVNIRQPIGHNAPLPRKKVEKYKETKIFTIIEDEHKLSNKINELISQPDIEIIDIKYSTTVISSKLIVYSALVLYYTRRK